MDAQILTELEAIRHLLVFACALGAGILVVGCAFLCILVDIPRWWPR